MYKIYCCVMSVLFLGVGISGYDQDANASDAVRYISNRVKVVRPEKTVQASETISSEVLNVGAQTKIASIPEGSPKSPSDIHEPQIEKPAGIETGAGVADETSEAAIRAEVADLIGKSEQLYSRKGRVDPFEPFLRMPEPEISTDQTDALQRRVPRTPLEKIDLSQLSLTGVLRTPTKTRALVQEASGKGYIISEGTYVGNKGGQVSKILKDRIVVEEKYLDVFGKISVRERELKLQQ